MTLQNAIKLCISALGQSQRDLLEAKGFKRNTVNERLRRPTISSDKAHELLDAVGYEMVIRPKDPCSNLPSYIIDGSPETIDLRRKDK